MCLFLSLQSCTAIQVDSLRVLFMSPLLVCKILHMRLHLSRGIRQGLLRA